MTKLFVISIGWIAGDGSSTTILPRTRLAQTITAETGNTVGRALQASAITARKRFDVTEKSAVDDRLTAAADRLAPSRPSPIQLSVSAKAIDNQDAKSSR
jgi:hypothetical protein